MSGLKSTLSADQPVTTYVERRPVKSTLLTSVLSSVRVPPVHCHPTVNLSFAQVSSVVVGFL